METVNGKGVVQLRFCACLCRFFEKSEGFFYADGIGFLWLSRIQRIGYEAEAAEGRIQGRLRGYPRGQAARSINYLGSGEYVRLPRAEWGVGMGHKQINGGLMPGGRLRMEKLSALMTNGRLDVKPLIDR